TIQEVSPADGDWKFDVEASYYGFGDPESGGTKWIIRNGLGAELDREGSIGGGLWVHFGKGNGYRDRELSEVRGVIEQSGGGVVTGAEVRLLQGDGTVYKAGTSGWDGTYTLEDIAPGTYTLEASLFETSTGEVFCCTEEVKVTGAACIQDLTLVKGWTVSYGLNGGGGTAPASRKVRHGTEITLPSWRGMKAPAGTAFLRWGDGVGTTYQSGRRYTVSGDVRFEAQWGMFESVDEVRDYLDSFTPEEGNTSDKPIPVPMKVANYSAWWPLLDLLNEANREKYIALDLSSSSWGIFFNPASTAGQEWIVSLILPDTTTSLGGSWTNFSALQEIAGADITSISGSAFLNRTSLISVDFPEATTIGDNAFNGCTSLKTVSFPKVTGGGTYAFYGCTSLISADLPEIGGISYAMFQGCTSLRTVSAPKAGTISALAFRGCSSLRTADFPEVTTLSDGGFSGGCTSLSVVNLPKLASMSRDVFSGCRSLRWVSLPEVTTVYDYVFSGCTSLSAVNLPKTTSIQYAAFEKCPLTSLTIPGNCGISGNANILGNFNTYYATNGYAGAGGTYIFTGGVWTGPF
ncbi:MAG: leucine-rich repeat protein, partial [Treponema sp.]|nr:leucine-rich repeat protein [Treponema sp.]